MTLDITAGPSRGLQQISPLHPDYATRPIQEGFDWLPRSPTAPSTRLYLVVFRSVRRRRPTSDLHEQDDLAYEEARESGGLLRTSRAKPTSGASACRSASGRRGAGQTGRRCRLAPLGRRRQCADVPHILARTHWIRKLGEKLVFDRI